MGGSLASSMSGEPRSTLDVDMVVAIQQADIGPLVATLGIVHVQGDRMDRDYLERTAVLIDVADLLRRALEEGGGRA